MNWLKKLLQASTLFAPPSLSNNKVLLISNAERGQANVFIATSQSLLKHHPGIDIHFASFPELPAAVGAVSSSITFHPLNGSSYLDSLIREGFRIADLPHPPGAFGAVRALSSAPTLFVPWNGPEYVTVFNDILKVIGQVDPGLVVVDLLLPPAHDAVRELDMTYAVMAPNSIKDIAVVDQPWGRAFWKFPIIGSAYPYPLPWSLIPSNIYIWVRTISTMLSSAQFGRLAHLASYRRSNGVNNPINLLRSLAQKPTVLVPSTPDIEYPMVIPENIVPCGPITPEPGAGVLGDRDPKLGSWLKEAPTVLVNLGTHVEYSQKKVARFGDMVALLLERTDVQVLWKIKREKNSTSSSEDLLSILSTQLASNRLRVVDWIPDLASVLDTGRIVCAVHHGGASSFHESLATGIPQVILPVWWDTYDYAVQAEWLGVGVWGNRNHAPDVDGTELAAAVLEVLNDDSIREKAREIAAGFVRPGRDIAAEKIVGMLRSGASQGRKKSVETPSKDEL